VSLLLCDIDHFKQINDVHGHHTGDQVLQEVATRLLDAVRSDDAVGRYGGEEFLIVLHGCGRDNLNGRAEQVRKSICGRGVITERGPLAVSTSIGAITIDHGNKSLPMEQFLKQADAALYRAKDEGRDRVVYAESCVAV
jgi:diguanylate cyclase (GGDEF)-like protein